MRRTRAALTALSAALIVLIVVAGSGNQWLNSTLVDHQGSSAFAGQVSRLLLSFPWRFNAPRAGNRVWAAQLVGVGVLLVLVFLLVWALAAGPLRSFLGTWFGVWGIVVLAAVFAAIARTFVAYDYLFPDGRADPAYGNRYYYAVFASAGNYLVIFAVLTGLVAGLVAALVAVSTARRVETVAAESAATQTIEADEPATTDAAGTEWSGAPAWPAGAEPGPWRGEPDARTQQYQGSEPTAELPRYGNDVRSEEPRTERIEPVRDDAPADVAGERTQQFERVQPAPEDPPR